ncbi:hypothetical protein KX935_03900 [Streptobacillus moniliformis]|uniref:hypothetical protein n=1 Tax=Streptobacillus moniliformis TaxID=34105 RepID=UPI000A65990C|nr:hypothetical protein [Streptobacillus moniliformis]QXW66350.1 hypothetical protein KX935_03900 [Streptobacillus moniliformis]
MIGLILKILLLILVWKIGKIEGFFIGIIFGLIHKYYSNKKISEINEIEKNNSTKRK